MMNKEQKDKDLHVSQHSSNEMLAEVRYCVRVQANHECWIADWDGDPGRTLVKENAIIFLNKTDAEKMCDEMNIRYKNRKVWVEVFNKI